MKDYFFEVAVYKRVKAKDIDTAKDIIENKTRHFNDCRKFTLLSEDKWARLKKIKKVRI